MKKDFLNILFKYLYLKYGYTEDSLIEGSRMSLVPYTGKLHFALLDGDSEDVYCIEIDTYWMEPKNYKLIDSEQLIAIRRVGSSYTNYYDLDRYGKDFFVAKDLDVELDRVKVVSGL